MLDSSAPVPCCCFRVKLDSLSFRVLYTWKTRDSGLHFRVLSPEFLSFALYSLQVCFRILYRIPYILGTEAFHVVTLEVYVAVVSFRVA